ncbi:MAG: phosphotransferase family protein [Granulosicoccus sp.]
MTKDLNQKCSDLIEALGIGAASSITGVTSLTGGVSSDIACVALGSHRLCVKFALAKLKVAADWRAPLHRNKAEYEWLQFAASIAPASAVKLYGRSDELHGFAMEYLDGNSVYLWKTALLSGQAMRDEARRVGHLIGRIHAASTKSGFDTSQFQNRDDFYSLRLEPYLVFTATKHPIVASRLTALADEHCKANQVLVHGDISPKNILFRNNTPIILDAECATMGDASFDMAFCLNHLVLKAIHLRASHGRYLESALLLWRAYRLHIDWEQEDTLEARVCQLLPALMLARVDGKSPVEYLSATNQSFVRTIATSLLKSPYHSLQNLITDIESQL